VCETEIDLTSFSAEEAAPLKQDQSNTIAELLTIAANHGKDIA